MYIINIAMTNITSSLVKTWNYEWKMYSAACEYSTLCTQLTVEQEMTLTGVCQIITSHTCNCIQCAGSCALAVYLRQCCSLNFTWVTTWFVVHIELSCLKVVCCRQFDPCSTLYCCQQLSRWAIHAYLWACGSKPICRDGPISRWQLQSMY